MKLMCLITIIITTLLLEECDSYRILGVFPLNARSHLIVYESLMKGLAKRGHQVDVITHYSLKNSVNNYNEIVNLHGSLPESMNNVTIEFAININKNSLQQFISKLGIPVCDLMGLEEMQRFIKHPPKKTMYDVVIVEAFGANCYMGLGYVFNVPVIAITSGAGDPWIIGNYDNLAVVQGKSNDDSFGNMTHWQRKMNVTDYYEMWRQFNSYTEKYQTEAMRKYLRPDIPGIREVEKNVALTFINSHPISLGVQPTVPTLVQTGGMHIEESDEKLTPELKKWMNESTHGVVLFTMGSMVLIESLKVEQLTGIYNSFKKIAPMRVLMKVVNESMLPPDLPENVKAMPWVPQLPVLSHPNTKIFITHCGLGGVQEALYFGVPMIGIPLFGDQFSNCEAFVVRGMMVQISLEQLSGKSMDSALQKLNNDSTYKDKIVYYSNLFRNQPVKQMDKAISRIQDVIRNSKARKSVIL